MGLNQKLDGRFTKVEEKGDSMDFGLGIVNSKITLSDTTNDRLQEKVTYLQSHWKRTILVFRGISEATSVSQ
ncbi:hypothetical protein DPMN_123690 [Dreissena polymorpha]|uniref:Uncharacterized protein n=1 Tax=Dreissena polymorpha TaxID=45954 RepID=A0A9D4GS32_DREPO|nr:hypothetical protein DPMN_123690 [Dreissena polymorpha]